MNEAVIISAARTAIGKFGGALSSVPAVELGSIVIREAIHRAGISADVVDEVIMGNVLPLRLVSALSVGLYGMFLAIFREIAQAYPDIQADDKIIDNACMQLVINPNQFDVMVMQNLYGDILSDLCSGLIGGLGLVPSSNIGEDYAMFEAVHGSAPDIAGKHMANPTAFLWSACMMLEYLGEQECAGRIRKAVDAVLAEGKHLTRDLHGTATTEEYVAAILAELGK